MIFLSFFCLIESFQMKGRGESRDTGGNGGVRLLSRNTGSSAGRALAQIGT